MYSENPVLTYLYAANFQVLNWRNKIVLKPNNTRYQVDNKKCRLCNIKFGAYFFVMWITRNDAVLAIPSAGHATILERVKRKTDAYARISCTTITASRVVLTPTTPMSTDTASNVTTNVESATDQMPAIALCVKAIDCTKLKYFFIPTITAPITKAFIVHRLIRVKTCSWTIMIGTWMTVCKVFRRER